MRTKTVEADVRESRYQLWGHITVATSVKDVLLSSSRLASPDKFVGRWSRQLTARPQRPSGHDSSYSIALHADYVTVVDKIDL